MRLGIVGKKVGMTQIFNPTGGTWSVTVIDTSGCQITQVKTKDHDKYVALQVGIGARKPQNLSKARAGHLKKAGVTSKLRLLEIRLADTDDVTQFKTGQTLSSGMFAAGDRVDVEGVSKGKGFQGVMRRFNFKGKHATHGTSKYFRHGGSNGSNTFPGRVLKNKGMPGRMGGADITTHNVQIAEVRSEDNLILLRGSVPGANGDLVTLRTTQRTRNVPKDRAWVSA
ncbi:MAG: 50S ribosomal protein L3 [Deltaproteobacteria bacterium]|nr:50S ribosomal protein L3 [Deltaproteobacteria bacterium]MBI3294583.1 50S ribosomal protein L3 [Deltaproteobacteria bacterium]